MQNFIVLGIIPGTHFQITFDLWLGVGFVLLSAPLAGRLARKRQVLQAYLIARRIARLIDRAQFQLPA